MTPEMLDLARRNAEKGRYSNVEFHLSPTQEGSSSEIHSRLKDLLQQYNLNDYAVSVKVYAVKPR